MKGKSGIALCVLGITFLTMGVSGRRAFLGVGVAFLIIGAGLLARQRRGDSSK